MPDVLHWLGIRKIHRLVSMSNDKYDAITGSGIEVGERVPIPDALIPADAKVEMEAKIAAGYFTDGSVPTGADLAQVKGRGLSETLNDLDAAASLHPLAPLHDPAPSAPAARPSLRSVEADVGPSSASTAAACRGGRTRGCADAAALPGPGHPVPQPLAPLRSRRRDRKAELDAALAGRSVADRARAHVRPDGGQRAAGRRRRRRLALHRIRAAAAALPPPNARRPAGDAGPARSAAASGRAAGRRPRCQPRVYTRSEGLGVASFRAFMAGAFSSAPRPCRADAAALRHVDAAAARPCSRAARPTRWWGWKAAPACWQRLGDALQAEGRAHGLRSPPRPAVRPPHRRRHAHQVAPPNCWAKCCARCRPSGPAAASVQGCRPATCGRTAGPARPPAVTTADRPHHRRLGALPQAQPVAELFAARAAAMGRRAGHRAGRADRPARVPQRRPAARRGVIVPRSPRCWRAPGSRATSSSSNGAR
jgi:hypothetical protein